jgi:hypothetical protein
MKYFLKQLVAILAVAYGAVAHRATIELSASVTGRVSIALAGRDAPFSTVTATGTVTAAPLGDFADVQSDHMTSASSFDQGVSNFRSVSNPGDSLLGTYFAAASSQDGILNLTSTLLN